MRPSWLNLTALLIALVTPIRLPAAQPHRTESAGAALQVSLLTFGPGRIYWERFGHDAILIRNMSSGAAVAYNYGVFDFTQRNFLLNFVRGRMVYRISADPAHADLAMYRREGRSVTEQRLNLSPAQRVSLERYLEWNSLPWNSRYHYDYFTSNCATRVRDAINRALNGQLANQLSDQSTVTGKTYRAQVIRLMSPDLWLALGMDLALGPAADRPLDLWQESFIPMVLSRALEHVVLHDSKGNRYPLVTHTRVLVASRLPPPPAGDPHWLLPMLIVGFASAAVLLSLDIARERLLARITFSSLAGAFSLLCGIGGIILIGLWAWTQHWATWDNQNLLLLNPASLLLLPTWVNSPRTQWQPRAWTGAIGFFVAVSATVAPVLHLLPIDQQSNMHWIGLILPVHLAVLLILIRAYRRARNRNGHGSWRDRATLQSETA